MYAVNWLKLSKYNLLESVKDRLYRYRRHSYGICSVDKSRLDENISNRCFKVHCENILLGYEDEEWDVPESEKDLLDLFLRDDFRCNSNIFRISLQDISINKLNRNIECFIWKYKIPTINRVILKPREFSSKIGSFVKECLLPISMRIYPQDYPVWEAHFGVSGLNIENSPITEGLKSRCIETLSKELNSTLLNEEYFEVPYDKDELEKLKKLYYVNDKGNVDKSKINDNQKSFLVRRISSRYSLFCAPEQAKEKNKALDMPFFWCRGTECFYNNLQCQRLSSRISWKQYSLYHLAEIMGYPKLHDTEAGAEPDVVVRQFIAIANKVIKKFIRLKCRGCGHLLFPVKSNGFNLHNYYNCVNPTCSEYLHRIYLNYCYKCKNGLIDSRDSKQCPNGWYICPDCRSCCDDAQYERLAQRYIVANKPVPDRIESKRKCGHNDKGKYYCHKCGSELIKIGEKNYECPMCHNVVSMHSDTQRYYRPLF